jgi:release factor glutamine methyltransferase
VELVLDDIKPLEDPVVLDVGTGSGVIALTIAIERPHATVHACDISSDALALASENALRHNLVGRVSFHQGDLLPDPLPEIDILIANLPYIPRGEISSLSREVQRDPVLALDGGEDGLDLIRRLAALLDGSLSRPLRLALEIGHDQSAAVEALLAQHNFRDIQVARDYQDVPRCDFAKHG